MLHTVIVNGSYPQAPRSTPGPRKPSVNGWALSPRPRREVGGRRAPLPTAGDCLRHSTAGPPPPSHPPRATFCVSHSPTSHGHPSTSPALRASPLLTHRPRRWRVKAGHPVPRPRGGPRAFVTWRSGVHKSNSENSPQPLS